MSKFGKFIVLFVFMAVTFSLVSCAAILNDNPENIYITSDSDADIYVNGNKVGTGSANVSLDVTQSHTLKAKKGSSENTVQLNNKVGIGWVALDIFCGLIPFVVDIATGSWYEFEGGGEVHIPVGN